MKNESEKIKVKDLTIGSLIYSATAEKIEHRTIERMSRQWVKGQLPIGPADTEQKTGNLPAVEFYDGYNTYTIKEEETFFIGRYDTLKFLNIEDAKEEQLKLRRETLKKAFEAMNQAARHYNHLIESWTKTVNNE